MVQLFFVSTTERSEDFDPYGGIEHGEQAHFYGLATSTI